MNVIRLLERIKGAEGLRLKPYFDHLGVPTIGYGTTYWDDVPVTMNWKKITKKKALTMLYAQVMRCIVEASKSVANFGGLCDIRQECLAEMAYQMGGNGLRSWKKSIAFINSGDWDSAYTEMLDSNLYRDPRTKSRAIRYAEMMYLGDDYGKGGIPTRLER